MTDDHALARELAALAGDRLIRLRARQGFADADELRDTADLAAHQFLLDELTAHRPDDAVLSEHGSVGAVHDAEARCWIVDPLDGTREFGEPGREDWAVHVALADARELVAGAVVLPARGVVLSTVDPPTPRRQARDVIRIVASRSRQPAFLAPLARRLGAEIVPLGSAGAKTAAVLLGEADAYLHSGGQYVWDSAAPVAVAMAGGFHASRLDGSPLVYRQRDPWLPDLLVCRPDLLDRLLSALRG
ncbi:MAG: 3'(2'),5'-bisphosphate nucleotidase CysQ [Sciscionella sp.]